MIDEEPEADAAESYVAFVLGGEGYALPVGRVREVLDEGGLTAVPGGSPWLVGLCNLRGRVVPVWDLRGPFGLEPSAREAAPCVLMVEPEAAAGPRLAGLLVDRVSDVLDVPAAEVGPAPTLGLGGGSAFVRGMIPHRGKFLLVLDLDRVLGALAASGVA